MLLETVYTVLFLWHLLETIHIIKATDIEHQSHFAAFGTVLNMCLSHTTVDCDFSSFQAVKTEAISTCCDKQWAPFSCILALSSVISRKICTYYPDFGP